MSIFMWAMYVVVTSFLQVGEWIIAIYSDEGSGHDWCYVHWTLSHNPSGFHFVPCLFWFKFYILWWGRGKNNLHFSQPVQHYKRLSECDKCAILAGVCARVCSLSSVCWLSLWDTRICVHDTLIPGLQSHQWSWQHCLHKRYEMEVVF